MKLQNECDVRTHFSWYSMKGPVELDATLVRSVQAICSCLIRLRTFDEIAASMVVSEDDEIEVVNLYDS
jgi:hypothetical protein